jgi:multicomponent K+:H+ antiporter subunit D
VFSVLLISSLLVLMAMARTGSRVFFKVDSAAGDAAMVRPIDLTGPVLLLAAGIALVVFADPVYQYGQLAAAQVVQPTDYLNAVLQPGDGVPPR